MNLKATCPEKITGPHVTPEFTAATGLKANEPCGLEVWIDIPPDTPPGAPVWCKCPRGHDFIAPVRVLAEDDPLSKCLRFP